MYQLYKDIEEVGYSSCNNLVECSIVYGGVIDLSRFLIVALKLLNM